MEPSNRKDRAKKRVGEYAASFVEDGMAVGLGTGSTAYFFILALAAAQREIVCVPTSEQTRELAEKTGLRLVPAGDVEKLHICVDGADEVDRGLNLVKGGGGAHAREKIIATMADHFIVVVDDCKMVERLGAFGVPVEVLAFGQAIVARRLREMGATDIAVWEDLSDNGNPVLNAAFPLIDDPGELACAISQLPGVVEHGIFPARLVSRVLVAGEKGIRELVPSSV